MSLLMMTLGAGTIYTIFLVGVDRGDAIRVHQALEQLIEGNGESGIALAEAGTTRSFVAVGILLALAGAVAFLVSAHEIRQAVVRARLGARLAMLRRRALAATREQHRAAAIVEIRRYDCDHSDEQARCLAEVEAARSGSNSNVRLGNRRRLGAAIWTSSRQPSPDEARSRDGRAQDARRRKRRQHVEARATQSGGCGPDSRSICRMRSRGPESNRRTISHCGSH